MAKRIIKETLSDGTERFRVEKNRILGFIPTGWHTDTVQIGDGCMLSAVFDTLSDAIVFCGGDPVTVESREIVAEYE